MKFKTILKAIKRLKKFKRFEIYSTYKNSDNKYCLSIAWDIQEAVCIVDRYKTNICLCEKCFQFDKYEALITTLDNEYGVSVL